MRIALVNFFYDKDFDSEETLLRQYYTLTGWAEALQRQGAEVIVISRFHRNRVMEVNHVTYIFCKDGLGADFSSWKIPVLFLKAIAALQPDIVHLHHFTLSWQTFVLRKLLPKKTAIILQHHGGPPSRGIKMRVHNFINRTADGYFFTATEQGKTWFRNGPQRVMPVMEGATFFNFETRDAQRALSYQSRATARQTTGMQGQPVLLWVARLDNNKDPITLLRGFDELLETYPNASLYMVYGGRELETPVKTTIRESTRLQQRVFLSGQIPHHMLEAWYNSADYFVMGSHYEGSSYALSEALSCGCIPIVTNIPSLHMMTDAGRLGALWQPGDKSAFVKAAISAMQKPLLPEANACIQFYRQHLSFDAIATTARQHYQQALQHRRSNH